MLYLHGRVAAWHLPENVVPVVPVDVVSRFALVKIFSVPSSDDDDVGDNHPAIFNVAWDTTSPPLSTFTWSHFSSTTIQLGAVSNLYSRILAYTTQHFFTVLVTRWNGGGDRKAFEWYHERVTMLPYRAKLWFLEMTGDKKAADKLRNAGSFVDLPLLFFDFTRSNFHFSSELVAPSVLDGDEYMTLCGLAGRNFLERRDYRRVTVAGAGMDGAGMDGGSAGGGSARSLPGSDLLWAAGAPRGNFWIRTAGYVLTKVLRATTAAVDVDLESFSEMAKHIAAEKRLRGANPNGGERTHVVLAPTHRSLYDFLLLSYVCFAVPELGLDLPYICADSDFAGLPLLGRVAVGCRAFFVKRNGAGAKDPGLRTNLRAVKKSASDEGENSTCFLEVFMEGTRSRDRRFVRPKTGFLRSLLESGGRHTIVPISISYERTPEQGSFASEGGLAAKSGLQPSGLFDWACSAALGRVKLGRVMISANGIIPFSEKSNIRHTVGLLQELQSQNVLVSGYHIEAGSKCLGVDKEVLRTALVDAGCKFWEGEAKPGQQPLPPETLAENWSVCLQFGHCFCEALEKRHPSTWTSWLFYSGTGGSGRAITAAVGEVADALHLRFTEAEKGAEEALGWLVERGFDAAELTPEHVFGYYDREKFPPAPLCGEAVRVVLQRSKQRQQQQQMKKETLSLEEEEEGAAEEKKESEAIKPKGSDARGEEEGGSEGEGDSSADPAGKDEEAFGAWGFADSKFVFTDKKTVAMKSDRYSIGGRPMPKLLKFLEDEMGVAINVAREKLPPPKRGSRVAVHGSGLSTGQRRSLEAAAEVSYDARVRVRHGHGHSQSDIYAVRQKKVEGRVPDAVVFVRSEDECRAVIEVAQEEGIVLVPYGGGTNVAQCLLCPGRDREERCIVSVDMRKLNKVLWVDRVNNLARIEAGITGRELNEQLGALGFTIGHEPDSFEFSTLGGWVATKASGMKKNRYGNIEDIVKEVVVLTAQNGGKKEEEEEEEEDGEEKKKEKEQDSDAADEGREGGMWQFHRNAKGGGDGDGGRDAFGRVSCGVELKDLVIGSEGNLGLITTCVCRVRPLPKQAEFDSVLLHDFADGVAFMRDLQRESGSSIPASVRMVDNEQFRLAQVMKGEEGGGGGGGVKGALQKLLVTRWKGFRVKDMVGVTIKYEGSAAEVRAQKEAVKEAVKRGNGLQAGGESGKAGYDLTFAIAYLRDFAMTYGLIAESFETFVKYSNLEGMVEEVKKAVREEHRERGIAGRALVSARVTQLYEEGACVYFYYIMDGSGLKNASKVFDEIELAARAVIMENGGSLSHHHGIGKHRAEALNEKVNGEGYKKVLKGVKDSFDPDNVFGVGNGFCWKK